MIMANSKKVNYDTLLVTILYKQHRQVKDHIGLNGVGPDCKVTT